MKTRKTIFSVAITLTIVLISTNAVFAQTESTDEWEWGNGMAIHASLDQYMVSVVAEEFDMSIEEVSAQFKSGSTFTAIALAQGILPDEIFNLMQSVHTKAIEMAVADGALSEEQAEWMQQVQFGGNARSNRYGNWTNGTNPNARSRQNLSSPLYQNNMSGSPMGRGGKR